MSGVKKRSTKRKKKQEATLVGDLFKILFAVSMLVVSILIAFFVFKNVDGFSLPDLKITLTEPETNDTITVTVSETETSLIETTGVKVTVSQTAEIEETLDDIEKNIESAEASVEAEESKIIDEKSESDKSSEKSDIDINKIDENSSEDETKDSGEKSKKETTEEKNKKGTEADKDYEETDYTDEAEKPKIVPENIETGIIDNGPVKGEETISESPVAIIDDGVVISNDGPVSLN